MIVHAYISIGVGFGFSSINIEFVFGRDKPELFTWEKKLLKPKIRFSEPTKYQLALAVG